METLNTAFFFVTDLIIHIQRFFIAQAWNIGRFVLAISLSMAAVNYAVSGQGLKENLVKIAKALVFFVAIMGIYPRIVGFITEQTFRWAHDSVYVHVAQYLEDARVEAAEDANSVPPNARRTFAQAVMRSERASEDRDPLRFFSMIIQRRESGSLTYTVVAPAAVLEIVLLVAGSCLDYARNAPRGAMGIPDFGAVIIGLLCGFAVMFVGIFAVIEYLMAFIEFMLVASVGIVFFPLSLWEGTKFLAEKLIGAIVGFFVKLLFCNICIFLLLFGYISLLRGFAARAFTGQPDEILIVLFISLLFFCICKGAPGLAQSLLTGTPSLSAAGAIGAAGSAIAAGAGVLGMAGKAGGIAAGGAAKAAFAGAGALSQAAGAASAARTLGGGGKDQAMAFAHSMGSSAKMAVLAGGGNLARSLLGGAPGGAGAAGGESINRYDQLQAHLGRRDAEGRRETIGEYLGSRHKDGIDAGENYMAEREKERNDPNYWYGRLERHQV